MPAPLPPPAGSRSIASFFRSPPAGSAARAASATSAALRASPAIAEASETDRSERERGAEAGGPCPGPDPVAPDEASPSPETRGGALSENTPRAVLPWRVAPESARGRPVVAYRRKRRATHPPESSARRTPPPPASVAPPAPAPAAPPPRKDKRPTKQLFLDLGQKSFGHVVCAVCGLLYARGEPRDEKTHDAFHAERVRNDEYLVSKKIIARGGAGIDDDDDRPATTANAGHHHAPARTMDPGAMFETPHHRVGGGAALTCAKGWGAEATAWRGGEKGELGEEGEKGDDSEKTRGTTRRVVFARGSTRAAAASGGAHPRVPTSGAAAFKSSSSLWRKMREVARVVEGELGAAPGWILGGEESSAERTTPKNEGEAAEVFDSGTLASSRGGSGDDARGKGKNAPLGGPKTLGRDVRGFAYVVEGEKTNTSKNARSGGGKGGKGGGGRIVGALFAEPLSRARWTVAPGLGGGGSDHDAGCVRVASGDTTTADGSGWARATIGVRAVWTHPAFRQSGVARTLLEVALRETVAGGYVCDRGECAFSQPTVDGARFAARTCGRADGAFLVYDE